MSVTSTMKQTTVSSALDDMTSSGHGSVSGPIQGSKTHKSPLSLVSDETTFIFKMVNYVALCGLFSIFGICTNIINIIVFVRQGFKDSMNVSLLGMAVADILCLVSLLWISICYNPLFANSGLSFDAVDVMYMTGGLAHLCFNRVTSYIIAFITLERCLCITHPLKVKTIITPARTKLIVVSLFVFVTISICPFYYGNRLEWKFTPSLNRTILSYTFVDSGETVELATFSLSVIFSAISFVAVIVCTLILIVKLNEKTKWRQSTAPRTAANAEMATVKDRKVVKMVTLISGIYIMCFLPAAVIVLMKSIEPECTFKGTYENICFIGWSFECLLEIVNGSVNFFVYLNMSSKFKATFMEMFKWGRKK